GQLVTGALSDRLGRKWLIAPGIWGQAPAVALVGLRAPFAPLGAPPRLAGPRRRGLPAGARRRLRRRRPADRRGRRRLRPHRRDLGGRGADRAVRAGRRRTDV